MDLNGKTALVTGSSSGIGQAIAIALARKGAHVLVHYHRNEEGAQVTLVQVKQHSSGSLYQADLTRREKVVELFSKIQSNTKSIDILVNNAGGAHGGALFDERVWDFEFKNNFTSALYTTEAFLEIPNSSLRKIINITSIYGTLTMSNPEFAHYSAAKAALANFTTSLAKKLGNTVLVNGIAPGYTMTPAWDGTSKDREEEVASNTVIGRFVTPEEIAHTAVFLAENDAMTGQIIVVDGGTSLTRTP